MPTLGVLGRTLVVSPHLDDAVFSAGQLLSAYPGATVVTVFAGVPPEDQPLPEWDARCGFASASQAIEQRREEDRQALTLLDARAVWLECLDAQYGVPTTPAEVAQRLQALLPDIEPQTLLFPLGLFHADHALVHEACMLLLPLCPDAVHLAYEDQPYRALPGQVQQRLMALAQAGWQATPARFALEGSASLKTKAVRAYASQLRGFGDGGHDDLSAPERCWRLEPVRETAPVPGAKPAARGRAA